MKYKGIMHYDNAKERYMIIFNNSKKRPFYLHCGNVLEVFSGGKWIETSIEATSEGWYLTKTGYSRDLNGLRVRKEL